MVSSASMIVLMFIALLQGSIDRAILETEDRRAEDASVILKALVHSDPDVQLLAERSYYDGLTFHRIVPNFVIQGGSPGANEYVGAAGYIRDEVGLLLHERGTVGISTRGRDTGDSQIFINLVDNYGLEHNYTVFAKMVDGMHAVDRMQKDDIIESIEIARQ